MRKIKVGGHQPSIEEAPIWIVFIGIISLPYGNLGEVSFFASLLSQGH
jgi:hypothetical protein